jgi:hypothetical protein
MYKAKLCGFAIAGMIGFASLTPITTFAAETNTESVTLSETGGDQKELRAAFEKKMQKANEKWKSLTAEQKNEIYSMLENEMQIEMKLMDKLVEFGVMEQQDATILRTFMTDKFNKLKQSGEFPLYRQKGNKGSK